MPQAAAAGVGDHDALVVNVNVEREVAVVVELLMPTEGNDEELVLEVAVEPDAAAKKKKMMCAGVDEIAMNK